MFEPRRVRLARKIPVFLGLSLLAGCIDSAQPLFTDARPLLGQRPRLEFYVLRDGKAREPASATFAWRNGRYVPIRGTANDIHDFTLHTFAGDDLIVQSLRRGHPAEYGIARKLAEGAYLLFAVDESEADEATRAKFCDRSAGTACRVATRAAVLAFAQASAAKPHPAGGLALCLARR